MRLIPMDAALAHRLYRAMEDLQSQERTEIPLKKYIKYQLIVAIIKVMLKNAYDPTTNHS